MEIWATPVVYVLAARKLDRVSCNDAGERDAWLGHARGVPCRACTRQMAQQLQKPFFVILFLAKALTGVFLRDFGCVCAFGVCVFKGRNAFLTLSIFIL